MRAVIAEDNYLLREGIERLLRGTDDVQVVGSCATYDELIETVRATRPDVVLTDIRMPPTNTDEGIRAAIEIRAEHPDTGVVVLSQHASPAYALALLDGDTSGLAYLLKDRISDLEQLLGAFRTVATGGSVIDPKVIEELISARHATSRSKLSQLTPRENEILREMAQGKSNAAIAASVFLNERSVEKHINAIFSKLHLTDEPDVNRRVKAVLVFLAEGS
ncbi:MAG TPA: response regulator transcription factor [Acidimicrobiales bacterium]|nr:response regulator transcription factor [Acidimicrobiales bacterium]